MAGRHQITFRATAAAPCPVCGSGTRGCSATADAYHLCRGEPVAPADWKKLREPTEDGFAGYRSTSADPPPNSTRRRPVPSIPIDWSAEVERYAAYLTPALTAAIADRLGLPAEVFGQLAGFGVSQIQPAGPVYCFPERDAGGTVLGLTERFPDGEKKMRFGGSHGLILPAGWRDRPGPVLVPEGASDTLALTAAGLAAVGRPSNTAGVDHLAELFRDLPADRDVLIVGENDRKGNGKWPGRDGAESTARRLAARLNRPVRWVLPPAEAKDVRDWLTAVPRSPLPWPDRGAALLAALGTGTAELPGPVVSDNPAEWEFDPDNPTRLAELFLATLSPPGEPPRVRYWRDEFHEWRAGAYHTLRDGDLKARLSVWLQAELRRVHKLELAAWDNRPAEARGPKPKVRATTRPLISNVLCCLEGLCRLDSAVDAPAWVDGAAGPDPRQVVAVRKGLYDLPGRRLLPATASFFSFTVAPFDFDPHAPPPAGWHRFLADLWPDDPSAVACLQEWFGYLLTPDTRQQKLLFILGPKRAGKGTIARVLKGLIGDHSFTGPTLSGLGGEYGLWPLLGKSVALISDARLSGKTDTAQVVERILSVTGEDTLTVNRKNLTLLDVKLNARFVILSNELPNLSDASGALPGRMILLRLTRSFYGAEDKTLIDRLLTELPGILLWAIAGYYRLNERGRFRQPDSSAEALDDMEDIGSPVSAFVREECKLGGSERIEVKELYEAWRKWCERGGRREPGHVQNFARHLTSAFPSLRPVRFGADGDRRRGYYGLRLRTDWEKMNDDQPQSDLGEIEPNSGTKAPSVSVSTSDTSSASVTSADHIIGAIAREGSDMNGGGRAIAAIETTPDVADAPATGWLYASLRLDLEYLPESSTDVVQLGGVKHYRISPAVVAYLEKAGDEFARKNPTPDQVEEFARCMVEINRFCELKWTNEQMEAARVSDPRLPDVSEARHATL